MTRGVCAWPHCCSSASRMLSSACRSLNDMCAAGYLRRLAVGGPGVAFSIHSCGACTACRWEQVQPSSLSLSSLAADLVLAWLRVAGALVSCIAEVAVVTGQLVTGWIGQGAEMNPVHFLEHKTSTSSLNIAPHCLSESKVNTEMQLTRHSISSRQRSAACCTNAPPSRCFGSYHRRTRLAVHAILSPEKQQQSQASAAAVPDSMARGGAAGLPIAMQTPVDAVDIATAGVANPYRGCHVGSFCSSSHFV